jgi:hypothetical protein
MSASVPSGPRMVRQAHRMKGTKDLSGGQIQPFIHDERVCVST